MMDRWMILKGKWVVLSQQMYHWIIVCWSLHEYVRVVSSAA